MHQVRLVPHEHDGRVDGAPHAVDELLEVARLLEAAAVCDGVGDDEALARTHVLVPHRRELRLRNHTEPRAQTSTENT